MSMEVDTNSGKFGCYCTLLIEKHQILQIKDTQFVKNNTAVNVEVKSFNGNGKRLEITISTNPSGYIYVKHHGYTDVWDYNFTDRICLSSQGKFLNIICQII